VLALMLELSGNWWAAEAYIRWWHRTGRGGYDREALRARGLNVSNVREFPSPASVFFTPVLASMWGDRVWTQGSAGSREVGPTWRHRNHGILCRPG
jgi:hypothetical protein